eukprot:SAG11_NODE_900_length_6632_cov_2.693403_4_plen_260_part_00
MEYGTPAKGQVIGGRWKMMHHALQQSAFADVVGSCGVEMTSTGAGENGLTGIAGSTANGSALCYVRNDRPTAFTGTVTVEVIHYGLGTTVRLSTVPVALAAGGGAVGFLCAANSTAVSIGKPDSCPTFKELYSRAGCLSGAADCMFNVTVVDQGGAPISRSNLPLTKPSAFRLPAASVQFTIESAAAGSSSVAINLRTNATALYVWLSTAEQGRFSDNGLVLLPGREVTVEFMSFIKTGTDSSSLEKTLRVEHLQMYLY